MRNRWTRTHINYYPCIPSELTNQVCLSIVVTGELPNETVNYDTKPKTYVTILVKSVKYKKKAILVKFEQVSEAVVCRFSSKQLFLKISQISQENTYLWDTFNESCNREGSIKNRLEHRRFSVKFQTFLRQPFLQNSSSGSFWHLTRVRLSAMSDLY